MNRKLLALITAGLLLTTLVACSSNAESPAPTASQAASAKQTVDAFGIVKSTDTKDVSISFPASLEEIYVQEGQQVKKGDKLFKLNFEEFKSQIAQKEIELNSLKLDLNNSSSSSSNTRSELNKLNSDLSRLQNELLTNSSAELKKLFSDLAIYKKNLEKSTQEYSTKKLLFNSGTISKSELESFEKAIDSDKKAIDDTETAIAGRQLALKQEISQLKLSIEQKSSVLSLDNKELLNQKITSLENTIKIMKDKLSKVNLVDSDVVCDYDSAIIHDIPYTKGETLSEAKKLFSIMNLNSLVVEANVAEEFIKDVKIGSRVDLIPQADKSKKYTGSVQYISNKAIQKNGETNVVIQTKFDNNDGFLKPDYNINLSIDVAK